MLIHAYECTIFIFYHNILGAKFSKFKNFTLDFMSSHARLCQCFWCYVIKGMHWRFTMNHQSKLYRTTALQLASCRLFSLVFWQFNMSRDTGLITHNTKLSNIASLTTSFANLSNDIKSAVMYTYKQKDTDHNQLFLNNEYAVLLCKLQHV